MLKGFRFWMLTLAFMVAGPVFAYVGYVHATEVAAIADHGKSAVATIKSVEWSKDGKTRFESKFKINVTFTTEAGETIHKTLSVDGGQGREIRDNDEVTTVKLNYLPEKPQVAFLDGETANLKLTNTIGAGVFALGFGMLIFGMLRRKKTSI